VSSFWFIQRASPPGKCHSCNIRETPEWRRGPDGARTLCNACGLRKPFKQKRHSRGRWLNFFFPTLDYAKLMRKRDKTLGQGVPDPPTIDMDTLRASARAADNVDKTQTQQLSDQPSMQVDESTTSPANHTKQLPPQPPPSQPQSQQQHHQGSFQLVQVMTSSGGNAPPPPPPSVPPPTSVIPPPNAAQMPVPTPPWAASGTPASAPGSGRVYAPDQLSHQSFMRTADTSPR